MGNLIHLSNANLSSQTVAPWSKLWRENLLPVFGEGIRQLNAPWFDLSAGKQEAPAVPPSVKAGQAVTLASFDSA